jgi:hypothetical protein
MDRKENSLPFRSSNAGRIGAAGASPSSDGAMAHGFKRTLFRVRSSNEEGSGKGAKSGN